VRRTVFVAVATALVVAASEGTAMAAGQALCVGAPGEQSRSPESDGQCKKGNLVTLATEDDDAEFAGAGFGLDGLAASERAGVDTEVLKADGFGGEGGFLDKVQDSSTCTPVSLAVSSAGRAGGPPGWVRFGLGSAARDLLRG